MATINQIAIYNEKDNKWEINKISIDTIDASNVIYNSSSLKNTLDTIINVLPMNSDPFLGNAVLVTDDDGKITTSGITSQNLSDTITTIPGIQTEISSINESIKNAIKNPTIVDGYFQATTLDETTNFNLKIPNTMREPATSDPLEIKVQTDNTIKPTKGGSLQYAKADHVHVISGSPTFVSPKATSMPALGSTENRLVNADYVTRYFTDIWNKTHYKSGSTITSGTYDCFGWITSSGKNLYIEIVLPKSYMKMNGEYLNFKTSGQIKMNLRSSQDGVGYVGSSDFVLRNSSGTINFITNIANDKEGVLTFICHNDSGWGVSNNSICTGNITLKGRWTN